MTLAAQASGPSRVRMLVGVTLALAIAVAVLLVAAHRLGPKHLAVVEEGVLYRSAQLSPQHLAEVIDRFGIRTVVNLRSELENESGDWHAQEKAVTGAKGVRHVDLPMNTGFPPSEEEIELWLELLADPESQPILAHCEYGVVRTGIMVGLYAIDVRRESAEQALSEFAFVDGELAEPIRSRIRAFFASREAVRRDPDLPRRAQRSEAGVGFVDEARCASCHAEQASAWRRSHHAHSMAAASEESVRGDFGDVRFEHRGRSTRFLRRGSRYYVEAEGPDGQTAQFEVTHTFGFEPLQQYLVSLPGGRLQAFDVAWDVAGRRWYSLYPDQRFLPDDPLHWTGRYQRWNAMCAECHSTGLARGYDADTDRYQTRWAQMNVGCQACHGPGERHVAWAADREGAARIEGSTSAAAVGLAADVFERGAAAQVAACGRCHSRRQRVSPEDEVGRPLLDDFVPLPLDAGYYYPDGQILGEVYVYGSFTQSRMYRAGVACGDCHEPHGQQLLRSGNALCTACHSPAGNARFPGLTARLYDDRSHHHHEPGGEAALCVSCHMPARAYMGIDLRRDHALRRPRPDLSRSLGVPNACNGCHGDRSSEWAARTVEGWRAPGARPASSWADAIAGGRRHEASALPALIALAADPSAASIARASALRLLGDYGAPALPSLVAATRSEDAYLRWAAVSALDGRGLPPDPEPFAALLDDPVRAVRVEAARSLAELATWPGAGPRRERLARAMAEYEAVQLAIADLPTAWLNLASFRARSGRLADALDAGRRALAADPLWPAAAANQAQLLAAADRSEEALGVLDDALTRMPDEGELSYSRALLLAELGRLEEAKTSFVRAAQLMPDYARAHYNLGLAYQHLGDRGPAQSSLERAHALDPDDPGILRALTIFHLQADRAQEARPYAEKLVAHRPGDPAARALLERALRSN